MQTFEVGRSVRGQEIRGFRLGEGPDATLYLGVHHGDEKLGKMLLERLMDLLEREPERLSGRRAVFVPVLNPDGYDDDVRQNANGVDLNRNLPTRDWRPDAEKQYHPGPAPASEPETRALIHLVETERPAKIVTIHDPLLCVNWNGLSRAEAEQHPDGRLCAEDLGDEMGGHNGYPVMGDIGYPCPGSFGSWAGGERRIPTITLELGRGVSGEDAWAENREALLAALAF